ncbi:unnamed protein product, partial [Didymodactylos carnosus]
GKYELVHVDEFIDELLREERVLDVQLPRLQKRSVLEENNQIEPRISVLDEDVDDCESSDDSEEDEKIEEQPKKKYRDLDKPERSPSPRFLRSPKRKRSRSRSPRERKHHRRSTSKHRERDRDERKEKRRRD